MVTPTVVVVAVVVLLPILWTVSLAFQDLRLVNLPNAGVLGDFTVSNFRRVIVSGDLWSALSTTLAYSVLGTGGAIIVGMVAALSLRKPFRGRNLVRAALLLPYVAPVVATTFVWKTMLNPQYGILNAWGTEWLGWDDPIAFLSQRSAPLSVLGLTVEVPVALLTVIAFEVWRTFPFVLLFLTARLLAAPEVLDEAARIDGATPLQRFRFILLPQLLPTIAVLALLRFIWTFTTFDEVYLLTGGTAGTEVVSVQVFNNLIGRSDVGGASATALVLAVVLGLLVAVYLRFSAKEVPS